MLNTRSCMREGTNEWMTKHITTLLLHSRVKTSTFPAFTSEYLWIPKSFYQLSDYSSILADFEELILVTFFSTSVFYIHFPQNLFKFYISQGSFLSFWRNSKYVWRNCTVVPRRQRANKDGDCTIKGNYQRVIERHFFCVGRGVFKITALKIYDPKKVG